MHGLRSVFFHLHPADGSVERYLDISRQVWLLICSRVNSLSIRAWAKHAYLLRPTFSSVYGIKHLFISLRGIYPAGEAHGLADLINTASQSLQSLRLEMSFISPSDPVRRIFTSLRMGLVDVEYTPDSPPNLIDGLCRLRRVDLSFYDAVGDEAVTFLNAHGESIDELKLSVCGTAGGAIFNIAAVRLPYLRKLSVAWNPFNWVDGSNIQFQHIWADADFSTLDHLEITSPFMDANDISIFCNVFERLGSNRMQHLQLPSLTVNTEILDLIWQTFPDLRTLVFIIPTISSESLISETAHREYPWEIDGVEITPPGQELGMPFYLHPSSYQSMRIAAKGTPSARSF
ncbi:hypothetical protein EYR36_001399 [Pleurotus pulmonarius]|nr:hypothetical protein EYR36_001399 [Pleurotus pulmonarius]